MHNFIAKFNMEDHMDDRIKENEISNSDLRKMVILNLLTKFCFWADSFYFHFTDNNPIFLPNHA